MSSDSARGLSTLAKVVSGRFAAQLLLVVAALVLPRYLGPDHYGLYAGWMAVIAIAGGIATFGLPAVEARYLAPLWSLGKRDEAVALASSVWFGKLALCSVAALCVGGWIAASPGISSSTSVVTALICLALAIFSLEAAISLFLPLQRPGALSAYSVLRAALTLPTAVLSFRAGGLVGVAWGLAAMNGLILLAATVSLYRMAPISLSRASFSQLRPYFAFAVAALAANLAWRFQGSFSIYALASWISVREAAYLALALQLYNFVQLLILAARRALTPHLAELFTRGDFGAVRRWGAAMMQWTSTAMTCVVWGWTLVGYDFVSMVLGESFLPLHSIAIVTLLAALVYGCAESFNMLLYVYGRAWEAALTMGAYAAATVLGLWIAVRESVTAGAAERTALAYVAASLLYFGASYVTLRVRARLHLPCGAASLLALPALAAPFAAGWQAPLSVRLLALAVGAAAYVGLAVRVGALSIEGWQGVRDHLFPRARSAPRNAPRSDRM